MDDATEAGTTPARERSDRDRDTQKTARATLILASAFAEHLHSSGSILVASIGAARDLLDVLLEGQTVDKAVRYLLLARLANVAAWRAQYGNDDIVAKALSCWELVDERDTPALVASVTVAWLQVRRLNLV